MLHCFLGNTCTWSECDNQVFCILTIQFFVTCFLSLNFGILLLQVQVTLFHDSRIQFQRSNDVRLTSFTSGCSPRALCDYFFFCTAGTWSRKHNLFHHLANNSVRKDHCRITIFEGKFKSQSDKICHFLNRSRCKCYQVIVSVSASFGCLEIVCLAGLNGT